MDPFFESVDKAVEYFEDRGFRKIHETLYRIIMAESGPYGAIIVFIEPLYSIARVAMFGLTKPELEALKRLYERIDRESEKND